MADKPFRFRQFDIYHDKSAMKVGTDGVLLGAWCNVKNVSSALDVGTGSGLIAIMLAQRNRECLVSAVEIDRESCTEAKENAARCPWSERINISHSSFQEYYRKNDTTFDLIVSNPPYFQNSLLNPDPKRSVARHAGLLPVPDLITGVNKLLSKKGKYCMILPVPEAGLFIKTAAGEGLFCRKITTVIPNPGKPPGRYLMEFGKTKGEIEKDELIVELDERHKYSEDFKRLTGAFYLYFRY